MALALPLALPAALCQALMTLGKRVAWIVPATESKSSPSLVEHLTSGLSAGTRLVLGDLYWVASVICSTLRLLLLLIALDVNGHLIVCCVIQQPLFCKG